MRLVGRAAADVPLIAARSLPASPAPCPPRPSAPTQSSSCNTPPAVVASGCDGSQNALLCAAAAVAASRAASTGTHHTAPHSIRSLTAQKMLSCTAASRAKCRQRILTRRTQPSHTQHSCPCCCRRCHGHTKQKGSACCCCCQPAAYFSSRAATPGSTLPSSSSREAPPPSVQAVQAVQQQAVGTGRQAAFRPSGLTRVCRCRSKGRGSRRHGALPA